MEFDETNVDIDVDNANNSLSHFMQSKEFFESLDILLKSDEEELSKENDVEQEKNLKKAINLINPYQEQPYLLDPHLEAIVKPIIELLRSYIKSVNAASLVLSNNISIVSSKDVIKVPVKIQRLFMLMYYIMKIRGFKTILKFFSHEVADLEPTFYFLVVLNTKDFNAWETRYVLLIWLSLICIIPFDLKTVDSKASGSEGKKEKFPLVDHIIDLSKFYLKVTGKERDAAAVLLSRLLTRRDIAEAYLLDYIQWARDEVKKVTDVFTITGIFTSLCAIYKLGQRQTLLPTLETAWPCLFILEENKTFANNTLVRKMSVKLAQRFGLCYLKPKVASWRYQRGNRSLRDNLEVSDKTGIDPSNVHQSLKDSEEEEEEIPDQIEEIIEILLNGLRNKDTVVRWSAAKGIGRLSQRLPQELADDVIGSLFELFSENTYTRNDVLEISAVSDYTWHGACLAIAELARRGLLLPERLSEVIPWVGKALKFDLKRGAHSIGSHVRDAACYVCWSFARAYAPDVLAPHVTELANYLVVVSVFDREVNVRRASSAAFQENVGRLGNFPHGIEIITEADYFAVGNRVNAFLNISEKIAEFEEYRYHLIDHLSTITITNWDKPMRELASKALNRLTRLDLDYMINKVLPLLIPQTLSPDSQIRHGALFAVGDICLAWSTIQGNDKSWIEKHKLLITQISSIIGSLPENVFTDFGSEVTCQAATHCIAGLAKAGWPINNDILKEWKNVVYDLLSRKDEYGQEIAVDAVEALITEYGIDGQEIEKYIGHINPSKNAYARRGFSLALGLIKFKNIKEYLEPALDALIISATVQQTKVWNDAETRRNSILSVTKIAKNLGNDFKTVCNEKIYEKIINTYFMGLEDYSTDSRGDVGSWIREASMMGLLEFGPLIIKLDSNSSTKWWNNDLSIKVFKNLLKQSVERIDRVRSTAGKILLELLYMKKENDDSWMFEIPRRDELHKVLPKDEEIHWASPSELYPRMVKLLVIPEFRFDLLTGLIVAAGGMTESLVRYSSATLIEYVNLLPTDSSTISSSELSLIDIAKSLLDLAKYFEKQDRILVPLLEVVDFLFEAGTLQKITNKDEFNFLELFECVKKGVKTKDIKKLTACMKVFCGMTTLNDTVRKKALFQLLGLLVHQFPKIRRNTADQLYLTLTGSIEEDDEKSLEIEEILTNTDWNEPISQLKETRNRLYPLLGVNPPVLKSSS